MMVGKVLKLLCLTGLDIRTFLQPSLWEVGVCRVRV